MRLKISHHTVYRYAAPVSFVVQSLRLTPSIFDGQKVIDWLVDIDGAQHGPGFRDGAGDWVQGCTIRGPVDEIRIHISGEVETADLAGVLRGHHEAINPLVYLQSTEATAPDAALRDLAAGPEAGLPPLELAHALSALTHDAIAYRPGVTHQHTSAAEALQLGEGVCQDHAHALIALARLRGLPARYVSGYLYATADGDRHEAAHAWAELHVAGLGWVGFDAANSCCPDDRYVRTGSGLDAGDAAPIRGVRASTGMRAEALDVTVAVERIDP